MKRKKQKMDEKTTEEIGKEYDFAIALLEDYSNCKTEIARSGLLKAIQLVIENLKKQYEDAVYEIIELKTAKSNIETSVEKTECDLSS